MVGAPFQASLLDTDPLDTDPGLLDTDPLGTDLAAARPAGVPPADAGPVGTAARAGAAGSGALVGPISAGLQRQRLAGGAWVDVRRGWVTGADTLFARLRAEVPWRAERRPMYHRTVDVPRLLSFYAADQPLPDPALDAARQALDEHYAPELGEGFATVGLAYYRDGRDSVAWHGDRLGRGSTEDTIVAILVLGTPRALLLRPRAGGPADGQRPAPHTTTPLAGGTADGHRPAGRRTDPFAAAPQPAAPRDRTSRGAPTAARAATLRFELGHGDLLAMGGSCQRTWEHAVPKTARQVGPRISVQFRPRDVR